MSSYRLYWYPGTCSRVPFVALEEIGKPYDVILENRLSGSAAYLKINPKGSVPALVVDDTVITENLAIQTYLARRHPTAGLLPAGDLGVETAVLEMESWFASTVHPLVRQLRHPRWYSDDPAAHDSIRANATVKLEHVFTLLEDRLQDREWLFAEWSLLDVYLLWLWFRATGSGFDGSPFPRCCAHAMRCEARPSVAKVLQYEVQQFAKLREEGKVPIFVPDFQVGHAPPCAV